MLQTALVGVEESRQCWVVIRAQHLPSPAMHSAVSLGHVEENKHSLCAGLAFKVTELFWSDL